MHTDQGRVAGWSGARPRVGGLSLMLSNYVPLVGLFVLAAGFALFSVTAAPFIGPRRYNRAKLEAYECGIEPVDQPLTGGRFPVKYYLTAMLFIVFDIEIVFLYPWAVANEQLGVFGLVEMAVFILTVFIAYTYVWRRGGLEWE
ncbi:NADH-quinone oxidoreductase subunit A [Modestobacter versicolor]|uniref:NADH-quinone oxidoreductase subunit A n=2 Tax=Modestobacter versicolor TaxID=429133 RepID=A0A839Y238_9ACTN|nr:NADH-quinone oxidoreductase subunit A [Modestobacter versicolor]